MEIKYLATGLFVIALLHTFCVSFFAKLSKRFEEGSARNAFFHLLAEVEVVFGFWAFIFLAIWAAIAGTGPVIEYQQSLVLTEPLFIFCIMILASTRPVVTLARKGILVLAELLAKVIPVHKTMLQFFILLSIGPLLGSFITEPAAITIIALLLYRMLDRTDLDEKLVYGIIALLFVNVSVGGALTHFAAPPILVVARTWGWDLQSVFQNLGLAAIASVFINTILFCFVMRNKIIQQLKAVEADTYPMPLWVTLIHLLFLFLIVATAHYGQVFLGLFLIFIGITTVTQKYQDGLKFKEALLVGFFLAGLMVFGSFQRWWLEPLLISLSEGTIYFSAIALTAVTDNAALTYLGSQVPTLSENAKWALVSGALVGGGLTILANAPNPAGFSILSSKFQNGSLNAVKLLLAALTPTFIAGLCFFFLGKF